VGLRAGLDRCGKSRPHRDSIPDRPARSSVVIPTEPPDPHINSMDLERINHSKYSGVLVINTIACGITYCNGEC